MTRRLKRIAPLQFGLMLGATYGLISLVFVPFILLFSVLAKSMPHADNVTQQGFPMVASVALAVILPVAYAVMGLIGGIIAAWIYNIVAKFVGGIEVEVE